MLMKRILLTAAIGLIGLMTYAQQKTIQERLGYPKETKLLIIHADDLGVSHSENMASIDVMQHGVVNSGSIMVPCPWFPEIAAYAKSHPEADLGLHLTLTSEWEVYKWGPVTSHQLVPSLLDEQGYFYRTTTGLMKNGKPEHVETELRSQIERALRFGIDPTHFDAHMAAAVSTPGFLQALLKLGREYKVPVLLDRDLARLFKIDMDNFILDSDVVVDNLIMAGSADAKSGMDNFYLSQLKTLPSGLSIILLHAAYDNDEMKAVTVGYSDFGSAWRQADVNFFKSEKCKKVLADEHIVLTTWREIRDKLYR